MSRARSPCLGPSLLPSARGRGGWFERRLALGRARSRTLTWPVSHDTLVIMNNERTSLLPERFAGAVTKASGSTAALFVATVVVLLWVVTGPVLKYSETWQLVTNGTTVVTFLMVFLIQRQQNKDTLAIHLKLSEIVAALEGASNRLINVQELSEAELEVMRGHYVRLHEQANIEEDRTKVHSVEEAHRTIKNDDPAP